MRKNKKLPIYITLTILLALSGILLPGIILEHKGGAMEGQTQALSLDYYSGTSPTISRNASSQLSDYEKMEIISGIWESTTIEADPEESTLTQYEAVNIALKEIEKLYIHDNYPTSLNSSFNNWWTWTATLYKATDSSFHTYAAYYWKVCFEKYDGSESHTALIMEEGTLLCTCTSMNYLITNSIVDYMREKPEFSKNTSFVDCHLDTSQLPVYPNVDLVKNKLRIKSAAIMVVGNSNVANNMEAVKELYNTPDNNCEFYCIYQLIANYMYMYTIIPYQP